MSSYKHGEELGPEAYPGGLKVRLEEVRLWAAKGLIREPFERAAGEVNREEAI